MVPAALLLAVLSALPVSAGTFPVRGAGWVDGPLVRGLWWGDPAAEAASRLGSSARPLPGLGEAWHLERALGELWAVEPSSPSFSRVETATASWVYAHRQRLLGHLIRVPLREWDPYERAVRRRFGPPELVHFAVDPPSGLEDRRRFIHVYRWDDGTTQILFIKPTWEDTESYWRQPETGRVLRLRILQKIEDPDVPLYIGAFDSELLRRLGASSPDPDGPAPGHLRHPPPE